VKFWVKVESREKRVEIREKEGIYTVEIDGRTRTVDCRPAGHRDFLSLIIDNRSYLVETVPVKPEEGRYAASVSGRRYDLEVLDERLLATRRVKAVARDDGPAVLRSPMPGLIVDVRVKVGDRVKAGASVVVLEAMKMQNDLVSDATGMVTAVNVKPGETVESQAALVEIRRKG
jgi:biotin carboxyl carrier protein